MPALNDSTRLFVNDDGIDTLGSCDGFAMLGCAGLGDVAQSHPASEAIRCPSATRYNAFDVVKTVRQPQEAGITSITHRLEQKSASKLNLLWRKGCTFDLQVHVGSCGLPGDFNDFDKLVMLYNAEVTSYSLNEPVIIDEVSRAPILETVDLSYDKHEEVVAPTLMAFSNAQIALGPVVGVHSYALDRCDPCQGSNTQYFTQWRYMNDGGVPLVEWGEPWLLYTPDNGRTWESAPVMGSGEVMPVSPAILNGFSAVSNVPPRMHSVVLGSLVNGEGFEDTSTLIQQGVLLSDRDDIDALVNEPYVYDVADYATVTYSAGSNGYLARRVKASGVPEKVTLKTSTATTHTGDVYAVDTLDGDCWVVGGAGGYVAVGDKNGFEKLLHPATNSVYVTTDVTHVLQPDWRTYVVCTIDGINLRSCNGGRHWAPMRGIDGFVTDISFYDKTIGYAITARDGIGVRMWMTVDGGISWRHIGKGRRGITWTMSTHLNWLEVSKGNPNVFSAGGRMTAAPITATEMADPDTQWDYLNDTGVVVLNKWR